MSTIYGVTNFHCCDIKILKLTEQCTAAPSYRAPLEENLTCIQKVTTYIIWIITGNERLINKFKCKRLSKSVNGAVVCF